jgi:hypothetical protein
MHRRHHFALLLATAAVAVAQPASPPAMDTPAPPAAAPRAISAATADLLKAALPKIAPMPPVSSKGAGESPDLRETDKPRNDIVRLPNYLVREPKPPVFTERELYGEQAFGERLARRYYPEWYLAFNRVALYTPLALYLPSAADSALAQYRENERLKAMTTFADLANMVMRTNPVAGAKVKEAVQETFMHQSDFGWQGGGPK